MDAEAETEATSPQDAVLSSLGDEWFRITLEGSIYAWICRREDGSEDGFAELSPAPWVHVGAGEVDERPCWINEDTQEFFFLEAGQVSDAEGQVQEVYVLLRSFCCPLLATARSG